MDDKTPDTSAEQPLQSLDLSALANLSLGPQWGTGESQAKRYAQYEEGGDRGNRSGGQRRDRRPSFDRPPGGGGGNRPPAGGGGRPPGGGDRGPRPPRAAVGQSAGAPRAQPAGGERGERGPVPGGERRGPQRFERRDRWEERTYFQPAVEVAFYPEDAPFKVLTQAIKSSCRTFELFEIARLILQKPERFVIVIKPFPHQDGTIPSLYVSGPDNLPFETESQAIDHVFANLLETFFSIETVDVEAPKGSYTVINRCTITGELLGPPNYHRYQALCQQHHSAKIGNMSFDRFMSKVESVRDPEVVQQWLQKMTKQIRYTAKGTAEGAEPIVFDNRDSARFYLITRCKEQLVRAVPTARLDGKMIEKLPPGLIRQSIEFSLEQQRHFPLDTANHLRGRLRRMNYSVYKKGSKGVSYVCAVKRRFRVPGQVFADSVQQLIDFIEHHPNMLASDLPKEYLGITQEAPVAVPVPESAPASESVPESSVTEAPVAVEPAPVEAAPESAKETELSPVEAEAPAPASETAPAAAEISLEDQLRLRQLRIDLRWLVTEGYVIEYSNARLFAPTPQANPSHEKDEDDSGDTAQEDPTPVTAETGPAEVAEETNPPVEVEPTATTVPAPVAETPAASVEEASEAPAKTEEPPASKSAE